MISIEDASLFLKAISSKTRLRIVQLLMSYSKPLSVNAIAGYVKISQSSVSQHLSLLKNCDLVESKRDGYFIMYTIDKETFVKYTTELAQLLASAKINADDLK